MRRVTHLVASIAILSAFASAYAVDDPMVYCTEKGKSYHKKNCTLKHGSKGMKLSEAKKKGYKPCKVCKPPK
jgi:methylphosphotriester-DNA--protein-cysteine methyltransferase